MIAASIVLMMMVICFVSVRGQQPQWKNRMA
jgi:hypothetical protein